MITNLKAALFVVGTFVQNRTLCRTYGLIMYSLYHYGMAQRKASALGNPRFSCKVGYTGLFTRFVPY